MKLVHKEFLEDVIATRYQYITEDGERIVVTVDEKDIEDIAEQKAIANYLLEKNKL